jgi:hypothetical protein
VSAGGFTTWSPVKSWRMASSTMQSFAMRYWCLMCLLESSLSKRGCVSGAMR